MNEKDLHFELRDLGLSEIRYFPTLTSTNDYAGEWVDSGARNLSLVITENQTFGRGRLDRRWISIPEKSLTFSVIMRPALKRAELSSLYTSVGAIAVCAAIEEDYRLKVKIKWPNDVLIEGKKICGVLAEVIWYESNIKGIIVGIGINLAKNSAPKNTDLLYPAAGIGDFIKDDIEPLLFLKNVLQQLIDWEQKIGSDNYFSYWEDHLAYKNKYVRIVQNKLETTKGRLLGVAKDGSLKIELDSGLVVPVAIGDVHLRSGGG